MNGNIVRLDIENIILDWENPRISEFGVTKSTPEEAVLRILWEEMAVNELMYSIVSNGFWDYEPLIVIKKGDKYIVIEGNRRLAAVKLLHTKYSITVPTHITDKVTQDLLTSTKKLPCIEVKTREEAWEYIGFKHVNGPAKWGSFAKAKYIAEIHNNFNVPLEQIAYQIGDTNNTTQKLYQGLMVLEQAKNAKVFDYDDIQANRIYFSHLYTGLQRDGIRTFLDIKESEEEAKEPVPKERTKDLGQLLEWLFGSKKNDTQAIIKSQNPDLKYLDAVLSSKEGKSALLQGEPLSYAYELSRPSDSLFEENLLSAKRALQKARAYLTTGYKGEENILKVAGSIANLSDDLYDEMAKVYDKVNGKNKKDRLTE